MAYFTRGTIRERFNRGYEPEPNSGCWLWMGAVNTNGYGLMNGGTGRRNETLKAHRVAWELYRGTLPPQTHVLHRCDNPLCVNPDHLFLGDWASNRIDMARKNRGTKSPSGFPYGAKPQRGSNSFQARVQFRRVVHYLGTYQTAEEASAVAVAAKRNFLSSEA